MAKKVIESMFVEIGVIADPTSTKNIKDINNGFGKMQKEAERAVKGLTKLQKGVKAITAKDINALGTKLQSVRGDFSDFGSEISSMLGWVAKAAAALAGVTIALGANTLAMAKDAQQIERQADLLDLTTDAYQEIRGVLDGFGVDQRNMTDIFGQIAQYSKMAADGGKEAVKTFDELGISVDELKGKSMEEMFYMVADGAKTAKNQAGTLNKLLGEEAFKQAGPLLIQGADAIKQLREQYRKLGGVIQKEQLERYKKLAIVMNRFSIQLRAVRISIATAFLPAMEKLADSVQSFIDKNKEAITQNIEKYVRKIGNTVEWVTTKFEDLDDFVTKNFGGWEPIFASIELALAGIAAILVSFGTGSAALAGIIALSALATALGVTIGTAGILIAGAAASVVVLVAEFLALYVVLEDLYYFFSEDGQSLIGDFVDQFKNGEGVLGSFARFLSTMKEEFKSFWEVAKTLGSIIYDVFVIGFQLAGQVIDEVLKSPFGRLISWAIDVLAYLNPVRLVLEGMIAAMQLLTGIAGPVNGMLKGLDQGLKNFSSGIAGGASHDFVGPMPAMSGAAGATVAAGGSSTSNSTSTVNNAGNTVQMNVYSDNPEAVAKVVKKHLTAAGRTDTKRSAGGIR